MTLADNETLTVETVDFVTADCSSGRLDPEIEIFDTDGTSPLAFGDDIDAGNGNYCAMATVVDPGAGDYFVRVGSSQEFCPGCRVAYMLSITIQ